jgi:hypothetical protein
MKRLTVRQLRMELSKLQEPVEVVRYAETLGWFVPHGSLDTFKKDKTVTKGKKG